MWIYESFRGAKKIHEIVSEVELVDNLEDIVTI